MMAPQKSHTENSGHKTLRNDKLEQEHYKGIKRENNVKETSHLWKSYLSISS